jgi:hypothetical protein
MVNQQGKCELDCVTNKCVTCPVARLMEDVSPAVAEAAAIALQRLTTYNGTSSEEASVHDVIAISGQAASELGVSAHAGIVHQAVTYKAFGALNGIPEII